MKESNSCRLHKKRRKDNPELGIVHKASKTFRHVDLSPVEGSLSFDGQGQHNGHPFNASNGPARYRKPKSSDRAAGVRTTKYTFTF